MGKYVAFNGAKMEDYEEYDPAMDAQLQRTLESLAIFPIGEKGARTIGAIEVVNSKNGYFAADEEHILSIVAEYLKATILRIGSEEKVYLEIGKRKSMGKLQLELMRAKNECDIARIVSEHCSEAFGSTMAKLIFAREGELVAYDTEPGVGANLDSLAPQRETQYPYTTGLCGLIMGKLAAFCVENPQQFTEYNEAVDIRGSLAVSYIPLFKPE